MHREKKNELVPNKLSTRNAAPVLQVPKKEDREKKKEKKENTKTIKWAARFMQGFLVLNISCPLNCFFGGVELYQ
jgi:hypothetical protein